MASRCDGQSEELDQRLAGDMNTGHKPVFFFADQGRSAGDAHAAVAAGDRDFGFTVPVGSGNLMTVACQCRVPILGPVAASESGMRPG